MMRSRRTHSWRSCAAIWRRELSIPEHLALCRSGRASRVRGNSLAVHETAAKGNGRVSNTWSMQSIFDPSQLCHPSRSSNWPKIAVKEINALDLVPKSRSNEARRESSEESPIPPDRRTSTNIPHTYNPRKQREISADERERRTGLIRRLAGEPGFEPGLTESESVGLPLTYSPTRGFLGDSRRKIKR